MPKKAGSPKTGGRKAGTPNKSTPIEVREALRAALAGEVGEIESLLSSIKDPAKRVDAISKLLPYILPRMNQAEIKIDDITEDKIKYFDLTQLPKESLLQVIKIAKNANQKKQ